MFQNATGIVVFAFGSPSSIEPNQLLMHISTVSTILYGADQVFTQKELPFGPERHNIEYISEKENAEPTLRIARWAVKRAIAKKMRQLIIIAATPHVGRCIRDVRWAIKEQKAEIEAEICSDMRLYPINKWFCAESSQPRSRSSWAWWPRELILRCMPMWLYTKVAG
ncbi:MAG: hypothetical protein V1807_03215 [Patescibacteria group bacterium]